MMEKDKKTRIPGFLLAGTLFLVLPGMPLWAQERSTADHKLDRDFVVRLGQDFGAVLTSPGDWKKPDLLKLAAISSAAVFCFALDREIQTQVLDWRTSSGKETADFVSILGDGGFLLGGLAVLYGAGEISRKDSLRRTALLGLESLAATTFIVWSSKFIVGRSRPSAGESSLSFHPFSFSSGRMSFPSGHAAAAFAVAAVIADESEEAAVDLLAYGLALLVGVARVYQDKHWTSDVFVGSALGYFVAKRICSLNRRREGAAVHVSFQVSPRHQALTLGFRF